MFKFMNVEMTQKAGAKRAPEKIVYYDWHVCCVSWWKFLKYKLMSAYDI